MIPKEKMVYPVIFFGIERFSEMLAELASLRSKVLGNVYETHPG